MHSVRLPDGEAVPALGQGTWRMGEDLVPPQRRDRSHPHGGRARHDPHRHGRDVWRRRHRDLPGRGTGGLRDEVLLVSKVYPQNAGRGGMRTACEASLRRLRTDRLDLYLLHWRGPFRWPRPSKAWRPAQAGKIRHWGVSNLDVEDMEELVAAGGAGLRDQPDPLQPQPARAGIRPAALAGSTRHAGHGLQPRRAGAAAKAPAA